MLSFNEYVKIISKTFPKEQIEEILSTPKIFFDDCHILYPADENGAHLLKFFNIEPIGKNFPHHYTEWIADDIFKWVRRERIDVDVVFAPNQPGVFNLAIELANTLDTPWALWEYLPNGRFGEKFWENGINLGDKVLVFNGVSQQGRCVGQRLPEFVKRFGGNVVAAAVFAKGNTGLITEVERTYGPKFYSAIQVDIPVYKSENCPKCLAGDRDSLQPWVELVSS